MFIFVHLLDQHLYFCLGVVWCLQENLHSCFSKKFYNGGFSRSRLISMNISTRVHLDSGIFTLYLCLRVNSTRAKVESQERKWSITWCRCLVQNTTGLVLTAEWRPAGLIPEPALPAQPLWSLLGFPFAVPAPLGCG